ncbi:MAG: hypothetical protein Kow00109_09450 [Acidobacteriota bacterium]
MPRPPIRRRRYWVHSIQTRLMATIFGYFVTGLIAFLAAVFLPLILEVRLDPLESEKAYHAATLLLELHARVWPVVAILLILFLVHCLLISHRIGGPLLRFQRIFEDLARGVVPTSVAIRRRDYLHAEAAALSQAVESLHERIAQAQDLGRRIQDLVTRAPGRTELPAELLPAVQELAATLAFFRLQPSAAAAEREATEKPEHPPRPSR